MIDGASGAVAASFQVDPYGKLLSSSGSTANLCPFVWQGHYRDAETGLIFAPNRVAQPSLGRWLQRDPLGESGGLNLYLVDNGDPINQTDRTGNAPESDIASYYDGLASNFTLSPFGPADPQVRAQTVAMLGETALAVVQRINGFQAQIDAKKGPPGVYVIDLDPKLTAKEEAVLGIRIRLAREKLASISQEFHNRGLDGYVSSWQDRYQDIINDGFGFGLQGAVEAARVREAQARPGNSSGGGMQSTGIADLANIILVVATEGRSLIAAEEVEAALASSETFSLSYFGGEPLDLGAEELSYFGGRPLQLQTAGGSSLYENGVTGTGLLAGEGNDVLRATSLENAGASLVDGSVPAWGFRGRATAGTLRTNVGDAYLVSGRGPAQYLSDLDNLVIQSHVEMHAAAVMRNNDILEGTLFINRDPCSGGLGCFDLLPYYLPTDSILHVVSPGGTTSYFGGQLSY